MNDSDYIIVKNPFNGQILDKIKKPGYDEVLQKFQKSKEYFENYFRFIPAYLRAEILYKVSEKIRLNSNYLAELIASEGGKPLKDAIIEINRAINTVKMSADFALNLNGEQISMDRAKGSENHLAFTIKQPIGPVLAISAFNHPVNLICHQVATAIAAGNTVLLKPAEKTPLCAREICNYFHQSGLEEDALVYLPLTGKETQEIITNSAIKYISFIGNSEIGWMIKRNTLQGVKVMLEHGGTAVSVVDKDYNENITYSSIIKGSFYHSGQVCVSTQILYVHEEIYDKFIKDLTLNIKKLKTGDALDPETDCGPLITSEVVKKMQNLVIDATKKGAKVLTGGNSLGNNCFEPTLLENINSSMKVFTDEVFGPILSVIKYSDIEEVINLVNSSKFAFQTSIFTQNIDLAFYYAKKIDQKACMINDSTAFRVDWMPFGGYKESGFGTGGIKYAINDMTEDKLIVLKNNY